MANLGGVFDASTVDPSAPFEAIPPGDYKVMIVDSSMDYTKNGDGQFLKLQLQVIDGPHQGTTLFDRLNLVNANPKAEEIAKRTLSAICHALGKLQVSDSSDLHNLPLAAKVSLVPAGPDRNGIHREAKNEIKGYKPDSAAAVAQAHAAAWQAPAAPAQAPAQPAPVNQAPPPAAGAGSPPWMASKAA